MRVLDECKTLMKKKGADYQNPNSHIKQAHHYPRGIATILDMVHQKITRMYSLTESGHAANFESIEDSAIDAINYLSFLVEYSRGKMDGQDPNRDAFNKPKVYKIEKEPSKAPEGDTLGKYYKDKIDEYNKWKDVNPTLPYYPGEFITDPNSLKTMLINDGTYRSNSSPIAVTSYMYGKLDNMNND